MSQNELYPLTRRSFLMNAASTVAALSAGAILAACGGSSVVGTATPVAGKPTIGATPAASVPSTAASGSANAQATSGAPTGNIKEELIVAIDTDPLTFDMRLTVSTQAYPMVHHVCEPLTFRTAQGEVIPWLAESWKLLDDLTYQMNLRTGVKFHNGEPFDAQSVKYTLECFITPDLFPAATAQKRSWLRMIDTVEVKDDHTVLIHTKYKSRSMLSYLSVFGMLPPKATQALGDKFGTQAIGTGPFKLTRYTPSDRATLVANTEYWGKVPPSKKLTIRFIKEGPTRLAALEAGEVAMINNSPPDQLARVTGNAKLALLSIPTSRIVTLYLTADRPPFDNPKVRQAVNYAIDHAAIVKKLLGGYGAVATSVYSPSILYYKEQPAYTYDPNKAKALLAEAGFPNGISGAKYVYPTGRFINDAQIGQALADYLKAVGIVVDASSPEYGVQSDNINKGVYECYMGAYGTLTLDPDWALNFLWNSKTSQSHYKNSQIDGLLAQGDQAFDQAQAKPIYEQAQTLLWGDAASAWLYYQPILDSVDKKLKGYVPRPDEYFLFSEAYVEA